jgi:hypothetical protein
VRSRTSITRGFPNLPMLTVERLRSGRRREALDLSPVNHRFWLAGTGVRRLCVFILLMLPSQNALSDLSHMMRDSGCPHVPVLRGQSSDIARSARDNN